MRRITFYFILLFWTKISHEQSNSMIRQAVYDILPDNLNLLKVSNPYYSFTEEDFLKCPLMCTREKNCTSFKYDKKNIVCFFVSHECGYSSGINSDEIFGRPVRY